MASAPARPGSVGEAASSHYHIPAASSEEVTMGTNTKGLMLEGEAGGDGEEAERDFKWQSCNSPNFNHVRLLWVRLKDWSGAFAQQSSLAQGLKSVRDKQTAKILVGSSSSLFFPHQRAES